MKVDIFTLCDSAQEYNGKLVIVGTFNSIGAKQFPVVHPEFALVARVVFDENEKGIHDVKFCIKKNESVFIMPETTMRVDTSSTQWKDALTNIIVKGNNIVIPEAGEYKVILKIEDHVWESDLNVSVHQ